MAECLNLTLEPYGGKYKTRYPRSKREMSILINEDIGTVYIRKNYEIFI